MKLRLVPLVLLALLSSCSRQGKVGDGGVYTVRSVCPEVGVPAATGDITLFNPPGNVTAGAIDVTATITNVRGSCQDSAGADVVSTVSFDVLGVRSVPGPARTVVLPYFNVVVQGGSEVVAKRVGNVALNFADGAMRAQTSGQATTRVSRAAATLPENVRKVLTKRRKPGDADAAIDPLTDPAIRASVARASFEHLVGFQMSDAQLRYNATR
ncbi:hypothetical protein [Sphingomonas sp.]|uniref:hypothetical protein n=1 Tax=Sphingomonas sp. TaxID=28214 RepID=UPI00286D7DC9|nr:hypothetical protein [Sphingomonas sp.]